MTRVHFYSNLMDRHEAISALVGKALAKKHSVTIMVENEQAARGYSNSLWQRNQNSFFPNVLALNALVKETPVILDWEERRLCQDDILINLSQKQLTVFSRFQQLIELVGADEQEKTMARLRYKFYRDRGYEVKHFDQESLIH
ncbi:MAG: DNA polymerase III subunit chi [Methylophilaceae bacterium]